MEIHPIEMDMVLAMTQKQSNACLLFSLLALSFRFYYVQ
jgi:hypothetical protein